MVERVDQRAGAGLMLAACVILLFFPLRTLWLHVQFGIYAQPSFFGGLLAAVICTLGMCASLSPMRTTKSTRGAFVVAGILALLALTAGIFESMNTYSLGALSQEEKFMSSMEFFLTHSILPSSLLLAHLAWIGKETRRSASS